MTRNIIFDTYIPHMNRRDFTKRLMALAAAPLAPALPAAAATTATGTLSGSALMHYPWAARFARVHDACSPQKLARAFNLSPETAAELFAKLQIDGVISAPGITGIARAVNPIDWDAQFSTSPAQAARSAVTKRLGKALNQPRESSLSEPDEPDEPHAPSNKPPDQADPTDPIAATKTE